MVPPPPPKPRDRRPKWPLRLMVNGIWYVVRSGSQWRLLPREFPPWQTVSHYFRRWRLDGTWEDVHAQLSGQERQRHGR